MRAGLEQDITPSVRKLLETRSKNLANRGKNKSVTEQEAVKSTYIRIVPLLIGIDKSDEALRNKLMLREGSLGAFGKVAPPSLEYNPDAKRRGRPTAGLTSLNVTQQGLTEGLVSIVSLKGIIPSIEDLNFYQPYLFTPGNYWLLEWGYSQPTSSDLINLDTLINNPDVSSIFNIVNQHRERTGKSEALIGCTKSYEYTVNEAGAFNFTLEMISNSMLFNASSQGDNTYSIGYFETPSPQSTKKSILDKNFDPIKQLKSDVVNEAGSLFNTALGTNIFEEARKDMNAYLTATPKDFFDNLQEYMIRCAGAVGGTESKTINILDPIETFRYKVATPYDSIRTNGIFYRGDLKPVNFYYKSLKGPIKSAPKVTFNFDKFNNELGPYCTWGWMEDNILSVAYGMVNSPAGDVAGVQSVDVDGNPNLLNSHKFLYTTNPEKMIIPGKVADSFKKEIKEEDVDISGDFNSQTYGNDVSRSSIGVLDSFHPIVREYVKLSEAALPFDNFVSENTTMYDAREKKASVIPDAKGSLRRVLLHWKLIQECFIDAVSLKEGLGKLYNYIEIEYGGFYKLDRLDRNETWTSTVELDSVPAVEESMQPYEFPTFQRLSDSDNTYDPFVSNVNLTITIPDSAGLAAMYSNNRTNDEPLMNGSFGSDKLKYQLITELSRENAKTQSRIFLKPTFQQGEIRVTDFVDENGKYFRRGKINPGQVFVKKRDIVSPLAEAGEDVKQFILNGWEFTKELTLTGGKALLGLVGLGEEDEIKVEKRTSRGGINAITSLDSYGRMYPRYQERMNYRLNNKVMVEGKFVSGKTTRLLEPVKLEFTILGVAGLKWGDRFRISYLPKQYKNKTYFIVTSVVHNLSDNNWTTTITGTMRYRPNEKQLKTQFDVPDSFYEPMEKALNKEDEDFVELIKDALSKKSVHILQKKYDVEVVENE